MKRLLWLKGFARCPKNKRGATGVAPLPARATVTSRACREQEQRVCQAARAEERVERRQRAAGSGIAGGVASSSRCYSERHLPTGQAGGRRSAHGTSLMSAGAVGSGRAAPGAGGGRRRTSETALAPAEAPPAALAPEPAVLGRAPAEPTPAGVVPAEHGRRSRPIGARTALGPAWALVGGIDVEASAPDLSAIEEPDRVGRLGVAGELHERKAPRPTGLAVGGEAGADDAARFGQKCRQLILGGLIAQVADEDLG
jgi:hypothetical protein